MNDMLASLMSLLASLFAGSMGWAIIFLALVVRLALLPLTLHMARKMLANQAKIKALQPEVEAIKTRLGGDPKAMFAAISTLYQANGARLIDRSSIAGALAQWPVFLLLYKAIGNAASGSGSFLWIRNLATPDAALTAVVLAITAIAAYYAPSAAADTALLMVMIQVAVTALVVWQLSAGIGLYWAASASVSTAQSFILRHERRRAAAALKSTQQ